MDRLEAMALLLRVAESGSFSAAARQARMPLPTLSRKIGELEAHLGTKLLIRSTRSLALTEAGRAYLASARRILDDVAEAERQAAGEFDAPRGELILTAPLLFGRLHILPVVTAFLAAYPEISVRLLLADRTLHLVEEHVDLAARIGAPADGTLIATGIGTMRGVVCASPALLARYGVPERPAELAGMPVVTFDSQGPVPRWRFGSTDIPVRPRLSVSTAEAAVAAAIEGIGATRVLHYQCAEAVRTGALRIILAAHEPPPLPVALLHAAQGTLPLKMRTFLDFAAPLLRRRLAAIARLPD